MKRIPAKSFFVNALTFSRVPLVFAFLAFAVAGGLRGGVLCPVAACLCAAAAGVSDFFDGMLARKWGVVSDFGKLADPLMDKFYFIVIFPTLVWVAAAGGEGAVHTVLLLALAVSWLLRDQWVTFLRAVASRFGAELAAMWLGKVRTAVSFPCAIAIYAYLSLRQFLPGCAAGPALWACFAVEGLLLALNLCSLAVYTAVYFPYLRRSISGDR